jgi:hypothetical protein
MAEPVVPLRFATGPATPRGGPVTSFTHTAQEDISISSYADISTSMLHPGLRTLFGSAPHACPWTTPACGHRAGA